MIFFQRPRHNEGIAIIMALLILGLISMLVMSSSTTSTKDGELQIMAEDKIKSRYLGDAGIKAAIISLREDASDNGYDTLDEIWSRPSPPIYFGEGEVEVVVIDEERKININSLIMPNGISENEKIVSVFSSLMSDLGIDGAVTDSILDWLDSDDTPRVGGAESSYYATMNPNYSAKNDLIDSIHELKLIKGIDDDVYQQLIPYVTVHGNGRVNINTAPETVLLSLAKGEDPEFQDLMNDKSVEDIISYREETPFEKIEDLGKVSSSLNDLYRRSRIRDIITTTSTYFAVHVKSHVGRSSTVFRSEIKREGKSVNEIYRIAN